MHGLPSNINVKESERMSNLTEDQILQLMEEGGPSSSEVSKFPEESSNLTEMEMELENFNIAKSSESLGLFLKDN